MVIWREAMASKEIGTVVAGAVNLRRANPVFAKYEAGTGAVIDQGTMVIRGSRISLEARS
jgi:hypothetical protein